MTLKEGHAVMAPIDHHQPSRKRWSWLLVLLLLGAVAGVTYVIRHKGEQSAAQAKFDPKSRPMPVSTAPALKRNVNVYLDALGTVTSRNTVTVKTRVDGELVRLNFREGQTVKVGELLAEIDPRPYAVQLAQTNAQLAKDKATLDNAQIDLERYKTLFAQDSIAKQQMDTQDALVRQLRATIAADQAQVDNAKLQLSYCRITSPISGRVGLRQVDPGNQVHAADANGIVTITQLQPITAIFSIPEDNLPGVVERMKGGDTVHVEAYDRQKTVKLADGALLTLDNQIDVTTGSIKLRAEFKNDKSTLFPNQFVNVRMLVDTQQDATVIPSSAVQSGSKGSNVYVVKNGESVELRSVKTGVVEGENVVITQGLEVGESVVIDGTDKLRDGAKIKLAVPGAPDNGQQHRHSGEGKHHHRGDA